MGILDDVVINAKTAAEAVGKKAGQIVDVSKLRFNVAELNAEISKGMKKQSRPNQAKRMFQKPNRR